MTDFAPILSALRRPRLLIRAAKHGMQDYQRERDLKRLMRGGEVPSHDAALRRLLATESELETIRKSGGVGYSLTRHVDVLIALMAEAQLRRGSQA